MPKQQVIVFYPIKGSKAKPVMLVRKTGYYNVWVNGRHYYYDYRQEGKINFSLLPSDAKNKKKQTITVRRR